MPQVSEITVKDAAGTNRDVATLTAIAALLGEVQASPTANTVLDRLKTLATLINVISGQTGITGGAGLIAGNTPRVTLASNDAAGSALQRMGDGDYETVAAEQTNQTIGPTGAAGDYLLGLLIIPTTTSPGLVQIKDGGGSAITVFAGGSDSLSNLVSFFIPLGIRSAAGAWQVTTGADVSVIAMGSFT